MGIFVFKFLEWWYSENRFVTPQQPIPPPPDPPKVRPFVFFFVVHFHLFFF
jgi:hypothetical protein